MTIQSILESFGIEAWINIVLVVLLIITGVIYLIYNRFLNTTTPDYKKIEKEIEEEKYSEKKEKENEDLLAYFEKLDTESSEKENTDDNEN